MKPLKFKGHNCVYAENQREYQPFPVHRTPEGVVTACWGFTWSERLRVLFRGCFWFSVHTFNKPLQPQLPSVERPDFVESENRQRGG